MGSNAREWFIGSKINCIDTGDIMGYVSWDVEWRIQGSMTWEDLCAQPTLHVLVGFSPLNPPAFLMAPSGNPTQLAGKFSGDVVRWFSHFPTRWPLCNYRQCPSQPSLAPVRCVTCSLGHPATRSRRVKRSSSTAMGSWRDESWCCDLRFTAMNCGNWASTMNIYK